jgi:hypothetical protein
MRDQWRLMTCYHELGIWCNAEYSVPGVRPPSCAVLQGPPPVRSCKAPLPCCPGARIGGLVRGGMGVHGGMGVRLGLEKRMRRPELAEAHS